MSHILGELDEKEIRAVWGDTVAWSDMNEDLEDCAVKVVRWAEWHMIERFSDITILDFIKYKIMVLRVKIKWWLA